MSALNVTNQTFDQIIRKSHATSRVDFGVQWCLPTNAFEGKSVIGKVDVDNNPAKFEIPNLQTFLLFKDGQLKERVVGVVSKSIMVHLMIRAVVKVVVVLTGVLTMAVVSYYLNMPFDIKAIAAYLRSTPNF